MVAAGEGGEGPGGAGVPRFAGDIAPLPGLRVSSLIGRQSYSWPLIGREIGAAPAGLELLLIVVADLLVEALGWLVSWRILTPDWSVRGLLTDSGSMD